MQAIRINPLLTMADIKGTSPTLSKLTNPAYFITMDAFADGGSLHWTSIEDLSNSMFMYRGYAKNTSTNFDNITKSGIYYLDNTTMTNGPSNCTWSYLFVVGFSGLISQFVLKPVNGVFAMRERSGSPPTWKAWANK